MNKDYTQLKEIIVEMELLDELIQQSLKKLRKDRDREVIAKRYGLNSARRHTLEQIGTQLGITRERVRQIEKAALNRIRSGHAPKNKLYLALDDIMDQTGGLAGFSNLASQLNLRDGDNELAKLRFLIKVNPDLIFVDGNDQHNSVVLLEKRYNTNNLRTFHNQMIGVVKSHGKPVKFENIFKKIDGPHTKEAVEQLAQCSKLLSKLDSNWGLVSWPEVNPRSIRDKVYIVLKKGGRPMHFSEIARKIIEIEANPKKVTTQAVHNELIKDPRFVLIGRGIYALSEWGYQAGTVADIIEEILREESPLPKEEIVKRVLVRRQVKVTTIVLNLQEKKQFERVGKSIYQLKKA